MLYKKMSLNKYFLYFPMLKYIFDLKVDLFGSLFRQLRRGLILRVAWEKGIEDTEGK